MLEFPWGPRSRPYPRSSPRSSSFQFESRSSYLVPRNRDLLSFQWNRAYPSLVPAYLEQGSFQLSKPRSRSSLSKPRSSLSGTSPRVVPASFHMARGDGFITPFVARPRTRLLLRSAMAALAVMAGSHIPTLPRAQVVHGVALPRTGKGSGERGSTRPSDISSFDQTLDGLEVYNGGVRHWNAISFSGGGVQWTLVIQVFCGGRVQVESR